VASTPAPAALRADRASPHAWQGLSTVEVEGRRPLRVFLLDDHELARRGLAELIGTSDDLLVVGEAAGPAEALTGIARCRPDVALLDVLLPDGSGIEVCREIRSTHPEVGCLMLTSYDDDQALAAAVMAGAAGYLSKQIRGSELLEALRRVGAGHRLPSAVMRRVGQRLSAQRGEDPRLGSLTPRERQVLELIADGLSNRQIGAELQVAEKTVKNHVSVILAKLALERRTQAAVYADRLRDGHHGQDASRA
jgi:DNA-binding NarL/FixJ family response regulator